MRIRPFLFARGKEISNKEKKLNIIIDKKEKYHVKPKFYYYNRIEDECVAKYNQDVNWLN